MPRRRRMSYQTEDTTLVSNSYQESIDRIASAIGNRKNGTSWDLLGGVWPQKIPNVTAEHNLYYAILRSALQTLVDKKDGLKKTGADQMSIAEDYWSVRRWIFGATDEKTPVQLEDCAKIFGVKAEHIRTLIKNVGL